MRLFPFSKFKVFGSSMLPVLKPGDQVLTFNWFFKLKIGDMVAIKLRGKEVIKRIHKLSDRKVFVLGVNLRKSTDSRHFGWVDRSAIIGRVILYGSKKDTAY